MIELLGWISTIIIVLGFYLNARKLHFTAMIFWIVGDLMWIVYDYIIDNWSHAALSTIIVVINTYGLSNFPKFRRMNKKKLNLYNDLFE